MHVIFKNRKIKGSKEKDTSLWKSQRYRYTHKAIYISSLGGGGWGVGWKRKLIFP